MPCFHPWKGFELRPRTANHKAKLKMVPYSVEGHEVDHLEFVPGRGLVPITDGNIHWARSQEAIYRKWVQIPCGQCIGCRIMYSQQWAVRCMLESQYHESSYFLTLTYNNDCVPVSWYPDPETGEAHQAYSLRKKDFQAFMKRLRFNTGQELRFYSAGEYGDKTFRPHYHAIIFGLVLDDLKLYKQTDDGWLYYTSPIVQRAWSVPKRGRTAKNDIPSPIGQVLVTKVNYSTCAYVARYVCKKLKGESAKFYETLKIEPPFSLMSRNPGLAYQWFQDHPEYKDFSLISLPSEDGGRKFRPPRYFDYLQEQINPEWIQREKQIRQNMAKVQNLLKDSMTTLDHDSRLVVEERALQAKLKGLKRSLEGGEPL